MSLSPEAMAVAERHAAEDLALLARLRASGRVQRRDGEYERRHPEVAKPFVAKVERLAATKRPGADTVRPNPKNRRKKGKR